MKVRSCGLVFRHALEEKGKREHAHASEIDGDPASMKLEFVIVGAGERSWILMIFM